MKKFTIKNFISELLATLVFLWLLWILLSWTDIIFHNTNSYLFNSWNFLEFLENSQFRLTNFQKFPKNFRLLTRSQKIF